MSRDAEETKIESFWDWFREQEDTIKDFFSDESEVDKERLIEDMNNFVLDFGRFAWEIGQEPAGGDYYLVLSPNGDPERLSLSKRIMAGAPELPDWKLHPARPSKVWDWKLRLHDDFLMEREVDVSDWRYVMTEKPGNQVEITFEAPNLGLFDAETQKIAAKMAFDNLLGEEMRIRRVQSIKILPEFNEDLQKRSHSIQSLREALKG